jgi:hypothetical protein
VVATPPPSQSTDQVSVQFVLPGPLTAAVKTWQEDPLGWLRSAGFTLVDQSQDTLTYSRVAPDPAWRDFLSFGILSGLIVRFFRSHDEDYDVLILRFAPRGRDTLVTLTGTPETRTRRLVGAFGEKYNADGARHGQKSESSAGTQTT